MDFLKVHEAFIEARRQESYKTDPVAWVNDVLGEHVWSKQRQILESVAVNKRTLVASCHASGKSFIASRAMAWWATVNPLGNTTVISTAPTWNQVANIMWKELERAHTKANLRGRITALAEWKVDPLKTPIAYGRKPADTNISGFQGIHDDYILVVVDEAGGVAESIFTSVESITTNEHSRILAIANPDDPSSHMAKIWREQSKLNPEDRIWNLIKISAFDTPNFTGEEVPKKLQSALLQKSWVEDQHISWGESDPRWVSKILAEFPDVSDDGLFNIGRVLQSMNDYDGFEYNDNAPIILGVDVARYGADFSVIASCQDGKVKILAKLKDCNGPELAREIATHVENLACNEVRIDAVGVGAAVVDVLPGLVPSHTNIVSIVGNAGSPDKTKWYNFKAAAYDKFSDAVSHGKISLPYNDDLFNEITTIKYEYRGSALLIESKEKLRARGVKSPDVLDAVINACVNLNEMVEEDIFIDAEDILYDDYENMDYLGYELWSFVPA